MRWLDGIPVALVRAHVRMLPKLDAEQSMREAQRIAVGTGSLARGEAPRIIREWQQALRDEDEPPQRPTTAAGLRETAGGFGIGFRKAKKTQTT